MFKTFKNKTLLITGGTGSFGRAFANFISNKKFNLKKIIIFSRDELKQYEMKKNFNDQDMKKLRFFIGDVRDKSRLVRAFEDVDYVVHAAALKQVDTAEYNPSEYIKTNIIGAENIIEASLKNNVEKVIALSTDKATAPVNLYGATKLCSDKLFSSANNIVGRRKLKFSIVRYGNVMSSRGSVIPFFQSLNKSEHYPVTHKKMTRFNITLVDSIKMVITAIIKCKGGEIFIPKMKSYRILDLVKAINDRAKIKIIGIRPGEKIDEELITKNDSYNAFDIGNYYVIANPAIKKVYNYYKNYKKFKEGTSYNSLVNKDYLSVGQLKKILKH